MQTRENYIKLYPGHKQDLAAKIFDMSEIIRHPDFKKMPLKRRIKTLKDLKKLTDERDFIPKDDFSQHFDLPSLYEEKSIYDENGMRHDDEYNPKNWKGHD